MALSADGGFMLHLDPGVDEVEEKMSADQLLILRKSFRPIGKWFWNLESDMAGDDWTPNHLAVWLKCVCVFI